MAELGFQGTPEGDPATYPEYDILYGQFCSVSDLIDSIGKTAADFKPRQTKCPLLLSNPYHAYDYGAVFADDKNATVSSPWQMPRWSLSVVVSRAVRQSHVVDDETRVMLLQRPFCRNIHNTQQGHYFS